MKVFIEKQNTHKDIKFSGTVDSLLKQLGINKETVIVSRNKELVTEDELLEDKDEINIFSIISGG